MLEEIFALDKRLAIANHRLRNNFQEYGLIDQFIDHYLTAYANYNNLSVTTLVDFYNLFAKIYSKHLDIFEENKKYPFEYNDNTVIDRITYDIALILSCVTDSNRYQIVYHLFSYLKNKPGATHICVIGAGSGIELALVKQASTTGRVTAYDLSFNDFIRHYFQDAELKEENFIAANNSQHFDLVFAIEFLEHVPDYKPFLAKVYQALKPKGQFVCTTATNMPQFDHLYNFSDITAFKEMLTKNGFTLAAHQQFRQKQAFRHNEAGNDWFVLEKN